jgi:hypothetical protein
MCDGSCDITPLLMSFLPSKGSNIRGTVGIGHLRVVIRDMADLSSTAVPMWDATLFFEMPCQITEQALIDVCAFVCEVPRLSAPEAVGIVLVGAMFPPICEVVEPCIEYGSENVCSCWGIVEDMGFKMVEGIGSSQGA